MKDKEGRTDGWLALSEETVTLDLGVTQVRAPHWVYSLLKKMNE